MIWIGKLLFEEPPLNRSEWCRSGYFVPLLCPNGQPSRYCRQFRDRLLLEDLFRRNLQAVLIRLPGYLNTENGVAPMFEEVVMDTDTRSLQNLRPYFCEQFLDRLPAKEPPAVLVMANPEGPARKPGESSI